MVHLSVTSRGGQGSPPYCGCFNTCLVVVFVPLPQVTLQSLHGSQISTLQSTLKEMLKGEITHHFSESAENGINHHFSILLNNNSLFVKLTTTSQQRKITFALVSVARLFFLQSLAHSSSILSLLNNPPSSRLGSSSAGCAAVRPL